MALRIASLLLAISPALIAGQDFVVGSSSSGACIGTYCCDGSLIGGTGNSNDASDFTCCLGDPNHGIINGVPNMTCSAGSAVPLTAATGSGAGSATRTSSSPSNASPTSDESSDDGSDNSFDDSDDSTSTDDGVVAATASNTASGSMSSSTTSQRSSASSSATSTSPTSNSASASSESASAGATDSAAVGGYQFSAGQVAVGLFALGYNIAL